MTFAQPAPPAFAQPDAGYTRPPVSGIAGQISAHVIGVVQHAAQNAPRSLQRAVGPSEIGVPCDRRLAYRISGWDEVNVTADRWPSTIGTAVHAWMAETFEAENKRLRKMRRNPGDYVGQIIPTRDRYLIESRIYVPASGNLRGISGCSDLFDRETGVNNDWKVVGITRLRDYRRKGPGQQYRVQAHIYGLGMLLAGEDVRHVAITFLPRGGRIDDLYVWTEPFDAAVVIEALARYDRIRDTAIALDPESSPGIWQLFETAESYCEYCPFFLPRSADLSRGCPGHKASSTAR